MNRNNLTLKLYLLTLRLQFDESKAVIGFLLENVHNETYCYQINIFLDLLDNEKLMVKIPALFVYE